MRQVSNTFHAHPFSKDGQTHVVITTAKRVRRGRGNRLVCGPKLTKDFKRRAPSLWRMGQTPATCDKCVRSMTGLHEILEGLGL